ncbi:MAG: hypothetical protein JW726_12250 [Anaerolineales bacterium]|nr:hypothetical protein [Anaerolineales bacterium]
MTITPYHDQYPLPVHHDGSARYVSPAEARLGEQVTLRLRIDAALPVRRVLLCTHPDGERLLTSMHPEAPQPGEPCRWWRVGLRLEMPQTSYRFLIFLEQGALWYNAGGLHHATPTDAEDFRLLAGYQAPSWVRQAVFYQIFPDRFADGEPANNVRDGEYEYMGMPARSRRWGEPPTPKGRAAMVEFYSGDLQGIAQKLDYIADLGATALYLNPIFSAYSNHRYDVTDYFHVDPHLGGDAALIALRQAAERHGLQIILDIVPNHCGVMHPWFLTAQQNPRSPSADYFTFRSRPDDYEAWLGVRTLPKLNYASPGLREVMYEGKDAVFRHWLRTPYAIDGWRIDVANMLARRGLEQLGLEVGRGIRQAVKEENPAAYLIGENFFDATPQLQGDCWDGVMNYAGFTQPLWYWLNRLAVWVRGEPGLAEASGAWPTMALLESWQAYRAAIPWAIACQQFNLLGSHDTPRIRNIAQDDPALNRLAAALLFTYPGVPCVYYGDEIGLGAAGSLEARQCMPWEQETWDENLRQHYQALIRLRRSQKALIEGGFQVLLAEENTFAFQRDVEGEWIIVVARRGEDTPPSPPIWAARGGIPDGVIFREAFSDARAQVENGHIALPGGGRGAQIWISEG